MALFGRKKQRSLFDSPNRQQEIKKKRRVFGRAAISETKSPYTAKPGFMSRFSLRSKKKFKRTSQSLLATPPTRLTAQKPSKFKKILVFLLIILSLGGIFYFTFFTDYFQIDEFQVFEDDTEITNNLTLNRLITDELQNKNIITYSPEQLITNILEQNPEFQHVEVSKKYPKTIQITLEKYPLAANIVAVIKGADGLRVQKKYLVNTKGMVIMENEENPDLPYIRIETDRALDLNSFPLDQEKLDYIIKLINLFEEKFGLKVLEAEYLKKAREVHLKTEKDFSVWFDLTKNMLSQIDKLKKALPKLDIYKTPLQYIDLRISGTNAEKVIYKTK
ncbi:FtsQ-type POTRA domain-containing protein [Candidatus Peregrinibacteria bacterium]|nr:FtsQ-type POTRA domain-containing protein [Candidatus Peregrinibacteria bacterium]